MLNLQICTVKIIIIIIIIIKKKKKKKKNIKKCRRSRDLNPGRIVSKSTYSSTTPWRPMRITEKYNQYILKL